MRRLSHLCALLRSQTALAPPAAPWRFSSAAAAGGEGSLRKLVERRLSDDAARVEELKGQAASGSAPEPPPRRPRAPPTVQKAEPRVQPLAPAAEERGEAVTRIHPQRLFYPGQTYKAEELVLSGDAAAQFVHRPSQKSRQLYKRGKAANAALLAGAELTNGRALLAFTTDTGKLHPRRTNKVDAKVQRALVRAIKTARMMALLPYTRDMPPSRRG